MFRQLFLVCPKNFVFIWILLFYFCCCLSWVADLWHFFGCGCLRLYEAIFWFCFGNRSVKSLVACYILLYISRWIWYYTIFCKSRRFFCFCWFYCLASVMCILIQSLLCMFFNNFLLDIINCILMSLNLLYWTWHVCIIITKFEMLWARVENLAKHKFAWLVFCLFLLGVGVGTKQKTVMTNL